MEQLLFSEIDLVGGGECSEECTGVKFKGMFGLGVGIAVAGLSILAISCMAACCGGYNGVDKLERAIAGNTCCCTRYTHRVLVGNHIVGAISMFGGMWIAAGGGVLAGILGMETCVPCYSIRG